MRISINSTSFMPAFICLCVWFFLSHLFLRVVRPRCRRGYTGRLLGWTKRTIWWLWVYSLSRSRSLSLFNSLSLPRFCLFLLFFLRSCYWAVVTIDWPVHLDVYKCICIYIYITCICMYIRVCISNSSHCTSLAGVYAYKHTFCITFCRISTRSILRIVSWLTQCCTYISRLLSQNTHTPPRWSLWPMRVYAMPSTHFSEY